VREVAALGQQSLRQQSRDAWSPSLEELMIQRQVFDHSAAAILVDRMVRDGLLCWMPSKHGRSLSEILFCVGMCSDEHCSIIAKGAWREHRQPDKLAA
jgi:hypothetical protein